MVCNIYIATTNLLIEKRTYIRDPFSQSRWLLFDDAKVTEVDEQTVWLHSKGGEENSSAYYLMYLRTALDESNLGKSALPFAFPNRTANSILPQSLQQSKLLPNFGHDKDIHNSIIRTQPIPIRNASRTPPYPLLHLSTSPPLFSTRNLLLDSPVAIPKEVRALVDDDNNDFEEEMLNWDFTIDSTFYGTTIMSTYFCTEIDTEMYAHRVNIFITKFKAQVEECTRKSEGDARLKRYISQ